MSVACGKHPQSKIWKSPHGPRCYVCGDLLVPGVPPSHEIMQVRHLDTFQQNTQRTSVAWKNGLTLTPQQAHLLQAALGLAGEAGEFVDMVKKHIFQGHPLDEAKAREEVGDICWYAADAASALNTLLSDVATQNEAKLRKRFPNGFSPAASLARADVAAPKLVALCDACELVFRAEDLRPWNDAATGMKSMLCHKCMCHDCGSLTECACEAKAQG